MRQKNGAVFAANNRGNSDVPFDIGLLCPLAVRIVDKGIQKIFDYCQLLADQSYGPAFIVSW